MEVCELHHHKIKEILDKFKLLQLYSKNRISTGGSLYSNLKKNVYYFVVVVVSVLSAGCMLLTANKIYNIITIDCRNTQQNSDEIQECFNSVAAKKQFAVLTESVLKSLQDYPSIEKIGEMVTDQVRNVTTTIGAVTLIWTHVNKVFRHNPNSVQPPLDLEVIRPKKKRLMKLYKFDTKQSKRSREISDENTSTSIDAKQNKRSRDNENTSASIDTTQNKRSRENQNTSTRKDTKQNKRSRDNENTSTRKDTTHNKRSRDNENTSTSKDTTQNKRSREMSKTPVNSKRSKIEHEQRIGDID